MDTLVPSELGAKARRQPTGTWSPVSWADGKWRGCRDRLWGGIRAEKCRDLGEVELMGYLLGLAEADPVPVNPSARC